MYTDISYEDHQVLFIPWISTNSLARAAHAAEQHGRVACAMLVGTADSFVRKKERKKESEQKFSWNRRADNSYQIF